MRKFFSINYSSAAFNFSMLLIRLTFGLCLLLKHGLPKLMSFATLQYQFYSFMGIGSRFSLILVLFAEIFCSMFIILGLFTRMMVIPLIIMFLVVIFGHDKGKPLLDSELALVYLSAMFTLLFCGPGRVSVDGMINR